MYAKLKDQMKNRRSDFGSHCWQNDKCTLFFKFLVGINSTVGFFKIALCEEMPFTVLSKCLFTLKQDHYFVGRTIITVTCTVV